MKLTPKQKADNAAAAASVPAQAGGENGGRDRHVRQRLGPPRWSRALRIRVRRADDHAR
jgi:hypothetical protein